MAPSDFGAEIDELLEQPRPQPEPDAPQPAETAEEARADADVAQAEMNASAAAVGGTSTLVWGIAGVVAFFVLGLFGAAWWSRGGDEPPQDVAAASDAPDQTTPNDGQPQSVEASKPQVDLPADEDDPPAATSEAETTRLAEDVEAEADEEPAPEPPRVADLPELPAESDESDEPQEPQADQDDEQRVRLPPLDPLAVDSANLDLLLVPDADQQDTVQPTGDVPSETANDDDLADNQGDAAPQIGARPQNVRFDPGSAQRGPSFVEGFAEREMASRLAMQLAEARWQEVPLHAALDELAQLSGVPFTVDPAALRMAGVAATVPVSASKQDTTVRELAATLAAAARLEIAEGPSGLVLAKAGADKWRDVNYRIDDLADTNEQAETIGQWIRQFVHPESWEQDEATLAVNDRSLRIHQRTAVHYDILIFCERLRRARGLATRSKYPVTRLPTEPRLTALGDRLDRTTTFAFVDWTPLAEVVRHWQQSSELVLLVDWQRLADQDLRPLTTVAASTLNTPWRATLDACLTPLGLDWVPVDSTTLRITTRDAATQAAWVEFYPGADADELADHVDQTCKPAAQATLAIAVDPVSRVAIVRGNRQIHEAVLTKLAN